MVANENIKKVADKLSPYALLVFYAGISRWACAERRGGDYSPLAPDFSAYVKESINAVKRLAVSTGKLRPLLTLHIRPIDPVVFREPMY